MSLTGIGIEAINVFCGLAQLPVPALFDGRGLDRQRLDHLMMRSRSIALPCPAMIRSSSKGCTSSAGSRARISATRRSRAGSPGSHSSMRAPAASIAAIFERAESRGMTTIARMPRARAASASAVP